MYVDCKATQLGPGSQPAFADFKAVLASDKEGQKNLFLYALQISRHPRSDCACVPNGTNIILRMDKKRSFTKQIYKVHRKALQWLVKRY